jgi:hypothetical protein
VRRMFQQMLAATAVTITALAVSVQPAQAAVAWTYTRATGAYLQNAGTAKFDSSGDRFYLYDNQPDGAGVYGELDYYNGAGQFPQHIYKSLTSGSGTSASWAYTFTDGMTVKFRVCLRQDEVFGATCSAWKSATT